MQRTNGRPTAGRLFLAALAGLLAAPGVAHGGLLPTDGPVFEAHQDALSQEALSIDFTPELATTGPIRFEAQIRGPVSGTPAFRWAVGSSTTPVGDTASPVITLGREGSYDVRLFVAVNGRVLEHVKRVQVLDPRPATADLWNEDRGIEAGRPTPFRGTGTDADEPGKRPVAFRWDFGDGSPPVTTRDPVHTFLKAGRLRVVLEVTLRDAQGNEEVARDVDIVTVAPPTSPRVTFTGDGGVAGSDVQFDGRAAKGSMSASSWAWEVDDQPVPGGGQELHHTFAQAGVHRVRAIATFPDGTSSGVERKVTVRAPGDPEVHVLYDPDITAGREALFSVSAFHDTEGRPADLVFDFGDGNGPERGTRTAFADEAKHTFAAAGMYDVTVTATFAGGEVATFVTTIPVEAGPAAFVDWVAGTAADPSRPAVLPGRPTTLTARGLAPTSSGGETPAFYKWTLPDGSHAYTPEITRTFEAGHHEVLVEVTFPDYQQASWREVLIVRAPDASVGRFTTSPSAVKAGHPVSFTTSVPAGPGTPPVAWNFGDGTTASGDTVGTTYNQAGQFRVSERVTRPGAAEPERGWQWVTVVDDQLPKAGLSWRPLEPVAPAGGTTLVTLHAATMDFDEPLPPVAQYRWVIDGVSPPATTVPVLAHRLEPGTHDVRLVVDLGRGRPSATREKRITVGALPAGAEQLSVDASPDVPVSFGGASVTSPTGGAVTITRAPAPAEGAPAGFTFVGDQYDITAPDGTAEAPLRLGFSTDPIAGLAREGVEVVRNGVRVPACATPRVLPCTEPPTTVDGRWTYTVVSLRASVWNLARTTTTTTGVGGDGGTAGTGSTGGGTGTGGTGGGGTGGTGGVAGTGTSSGLSLGVTAAAQKVSAVARKGLLATARCSAACTLTVKVSLDAATAKRLGLRGTIGTAKVTLAGAGSKAVAVKVSAKARKALKRLKRGKAVVVVAGGGRTATTTVALRR